MTTTVTSADASAKSYHDSLMKALNAVISASNQLKGQLQTRNQDKDVELTTRFKILSNIEETILKQVQETSPTPDGVVKAICWLESYRGFTEEQYVDMSNLSQLVATQQEPNLKEAFNVFKPSSWRNLLRSTQQEPNLKEALRELTGRIVEAQEFINGLEKPEEVFPAATHVGIASSGGTSPGIAAGPSGASSASSGAGSPPSSTAVIVPAQISASSVVTATGSSGSLNPSATPLIISLLLANNRNNKNDPIVTATGALLNGQAPSPALQDSDIDLLIKAWRKAVDTFTTNLAPHPATSLQLAKLVGLIKLHAQLEVLYDQLINIEESTRVSVTSLLSIR